MSISAEDDALALSLTQDKDGAASSTDGAAELAIEVIRHAVSPSPATTTQISSEVVASDAEGLHEPVDVMNGPRQGVEEGRNGDVSSYVDMSPRSSMAEGPSRVPMADVTGWNVTEIGRRVFVTG